MHGFYNIWSIIGITNNTFFSVVQLFASPCHWKKSVRHSVRVFSTDDVICFSIAKYLFVCLSVCISQSLVHSCFGCKLKTTVWPWLPIDLQHLYLQQINHCLCIDIKMNSTDLIGFYWSLYFSQWLTWGNPSSYQSINQRVRWRRLPNVLRQTKHLFYRRCPRYRISKRDK